MLLVALYTGNVRKHQKLDAETEERPALESGPSRSIGISFVVCSVVMFL